MGGLKNLGLIKPRARLSIDEQKRLRVPDHPAFRVSRSDSDEMLEWAVPHWVADIIDDDASVRWSWTLPDGVPFVGGKDAYLGVSHLTNSLKAFKFVLAAGQSIDLLSRKTFGGWGSPFKSMPWLRTPNFSESGTMFTTYWKGPERRRKAVLDIAMSEEPVVQGRPGITHRAYIRNGLSGADKSWFTKAGNEYLPELFERAAKRSNLPARVTAAGVNYFRDGMFEVAYRMSMISYMDHVEIPRQIRVNPGWTDDEVMQSATRVTNRKFSSPQAWDNYIFGNPKFVNLMRNVFLSVNELTSWVGMATEAMPLPRRVPVDADGKELLPADHKRLIINPESHRVLGVDENIADFQGSRMSRGKLVPRAEWKLANTDIRSFMGSFMGLIASYAVIATILDTSAGVVAGEGFNVNPDLYNPVTTGGDPMLGVNYSSRFVSPRIPFAQGRGGRDVRLDLIGQADTAFRLLDPEGFFLSRLSVPGRAFQNQLSGETFWGEQFGLDLKRLSQAMIDIAPLSGGAVQAGLRRVDALEEYIPAGEERLGLGGQVGQAMVGVNLRAENNPELRDRFAQERYQKNYSDLEPYRRKIIQKHGDQATGGEFTKTSQTAAERNTPWGRLGHRLNELDQEEQARLEEMASFAGTETGGYSPQGREEQAKVIRAYYNLKAEMSNRRDEARENLSGQGDKEFEAEGPLEEGLEGYYELFEQSATPAGNFDSAKYVEMRDAYMATLTRRQENYVLRNTNTTEVPDGLMVFFQQALPNEFQKIEQSSQARQRNGG